MLLVTLILHLFTSIECPIDSGASYHMGKDQAIFSTIHECNTKQIFVGDDRSLSVVGSGNSSSRKWSFQ